MSLLQAGVSLLQEGESLLQAVYRCSRQVLDQRAEYFLLL